MSLTISDLARDFGKQPSDITWGITLVLMFRSVGSIAFGIASDRYGRKWPFVINNILFIILELVSILLLSSCLPTLFLSLFSSLHTQLLSSNQEKNMQHCHVLG